MALLNGAKRIKTLQPLRHDAGLQSFWCAVLPCLGQRSRGGEQRFADVLAG